MDSITFNLDEFCADCLTCVKYARLETLSHEAEHSGSHCCNGFGVARSCRREPTPASSEPVGPSLSGILAETVGLGGLILVEVFSFL